MRVAGFDLYRYSLPLTAPLKLAGATLHRREGLLLELRGEDGPTGWGEAAPLPGFSRESIEEAARAVCLLAETWDPTKPKLPNDTLEAPPSARFGFETALWNLRASERGTSLSKTLCREPATEITLNGLLSGTAEEVLGEALRMRASGYRAVKLKVGRRSIRGDIDLVLALRSEIGAAVELRLDANRAWSFEEAASFVRGVDGVGFAYIEEPLSDASRLPEFVRYLDVPVALDESLVGLAVEDLERHRYASAVVIKPTLLGGISHVLSLAKRAGEFGMTPVISSAYESGVGMAALISIAAATAPEPAPAGLDTYRRLAEDTIHPRLNLTAPTINLHDIEYLHVMRERVVRERRTRLP